MVSKKRHKSFGTPQGLNVEPLTFDLYDEEFTAYPEIQGSKLLQFSAHVGSDEQGESSEALLGFFETVLHPESYERMNLLWNDPERVVPIEMLSDIISWLIEEYTDRPTPASS